MTINRERLDTYTFGHGSRENYLNTLAFGAPRGYPRRRGLSGLGMWPFDNTPSISEGLEMAKDRWDDWFGSETPTQTPAGTVADTSTQTTPSSTGVYVGGTATVGTAKDVVIPSSAPAPAKAPTSTSMTPPPQANTGIKPGAINPNFDAWVGVVFAIVFWATCDGTWNLKRWVRHFVGEGK